MSRERVVRQVAQAAAHRHPEECAQRLERMRTSDIVEFLERQDPALAAALLRRLRSDRASQVVEALPDPAASKILAALEPALAAAMLSRLDDEAREARLAALDQHLAKELRELLAYPPGVAGAVMDPRVMTFRPDTTAREALAQVRAAGGRGVQDAYVVDPEGRLEGVVSVHDLALAEPSAVLGDLAQPAVRVQAFTPHDELVAIADEGRLTSVPVVDVGGRLLGVIRSADLLRTSQRDATADLQTMVGASEDERALSGPWFAVRKRLPWLQINLGTAFLAAAVVGLFEDTIARFTALAVLLPVVAGQSGNAGSQALAVTIRGLALREVRLRHWWRVGRKELLVGFLNGVAVALVTSLAVWVWSRSVGMALVIGAAMVCSMVIAGIAGAAVPMVLTAMRQDPAASSSIVLTTVTDVMGFLTFLGFATLASGML